MDSDRDKNQGQTEPWSKRWGYGALQLWARSGHWPLIRAGMWHRARRAQVKMYQSMWASSTSAINDAWGLRSFPSSPHFYAALLLSKKKQKCSSQQHWGFAAGLCPSPGSWGVLQGSALCYNKGHQGHGGTWDPTAPHRWYPSSQRSCSVSEQHSSSYWR